MLGSGYRLQRHPPRFWGGRADAGVRPLSPPSCSRHACGWRNGERRSAQLFRTRCVQVLCGPLRQKLSHDLHAAVREGAMSYPTHYNMEAVWKILDYFSTPGPGPVYGDRGHPLSYSASAGRLRPKPVACSKAWAIRRTPRSSQYRPTIWMPTGNPSEVKPAGTEMAGRKVTVIQ